MEGEKEDEDRTEERRRVEMLEGKRHGKDGR